MLYIYVPTSNLWILSVEGIINLSNRFVATNLGNNLTNMYSITITNFGIPLDVFNFMVGMFSSAVKRGPMQILL